MSPRPTSALKRWYAALLAVCLTALASWPVPAEAQATQLEILWTRGHERGVTQAAFFPGAERIATTGHDGEIEVWDINGSAIVGLYRGHDARISSLAIAPSGRRFASGDVDGNVLLWDYGNPRAYRLHQHSGEVGELAFVAEGHLVSFGWDETPSKKVANLVDHWVGDSVSSPADEFDRADLAKLRFLGSRYVLTETDDGTERLFDLESRHPATLPIGGIFQRVEDVLGHSHVSLHLLSKTQVIAGSTSFYGSDPQLVGVDLATADAFDLALCNAFQCVRDRFEIIAADEDTRRVAFLFRGPEILQSLEPPSAGPAANYADGLMVANIGSLDAATEGGPEWREEGSNVGLVMTNLRRLTKHRVYNKSPWLKEEPAHSERRVVGASKAAIDRLIKSDLWPAETDADASERTSFYVQAEDLRYGGGVHIERSSGKQEQSLTMTNDTISHTTELQSLGSFLCGSGGRYCSDGAQLVGLSPSGSFAFASLDAYIGVGSRLWLFHDMEELLQTSEGLAMDEIVGDELAWKSLLSEDNISVLMPSVESVEPAAQAAISRFQLEREGLVESGVLDARTRLALGLPSRLPKPDGRPGRWLVYQLPHELRSRFTDAGMAFSPDGSRMVLGYGSGEIKLLNLDTGVLDILLDADADAEGDLVTVGFAGPERVVAVYPNRFDLLNLNGQISGATRAPRLAAMRDVWTFGGGKLLAVANDQSAVLFRRESPGSNFSEVLRTRDFGEDGWLAIEPHGFFAGDVTGLRSISVRVGADVVDVSEFDSLLYRPDLVREAIRGDPEGLIERAAKAVENMVEDGVPP